MMDGSNIPMTDVAPKQRAALRIWLADLTYTQQQISAELIPQAIGGIATFTEIRAGLAEPIRLFKYPEALARAMAEGAAPDVIGFSNYVWNTNLSLAFARRLQALAPRTVMVFGGPHYPIIAREQEAYLRAHPEIDFYIVKEGELAFANLVAALAETRLDKEAVKRRELASVHAIDAVGVAHLTDTVARIRDLSEIPSPYTGGRLDEFFDGKLLPIIQTNRGCPFSCTFCVEGTAYYNKIYTNAQAKVSAEIDYIGRKMREVRGQGGRNDLFIADSNFGMYKDDLDTCRAIARAQDEYQWPEYINVATGKNQKARVLEAARLVRGAMRLSGSVQSLDEDVLRNVKRNNIAADQLMQLALQSADVDANSYSEVILGLPGDSKAAHCKTLGTIIDAGFNKVIPYTMMMLPGSEMCTEESKQKYGMELRFRVLPRCFGFYDICGERAVSAEIEEVCVATDTLPYEDYLACRRLHLMISIFYNDGVFGGLLKFLRQSGISIYRWLETLSEAKVEGPLGRLIADFEQATRDELWLDRTELEAFIRKPGTIERYISGELGLNLLFTFKSIAMTRHIEALAQLARATARRMIAEALPDPAARMAFIDDVVLFDASRMTNLFDSMQTPVSAAFRYDIARYLVDGEAGSVSVYAFDRPRAIGFLLDDGQRATIERGLKLFGRDDAGVGRILSKFHITRLLRRPEPIEGGEADVAAIAGAARVPTRNVAAPINLLDS
jgi:radical SAM superfamily enzyme YgiQ (UPF0313 family)